VENVQDALLAVTTWVGLAGIFVVGGAGLFRLAVWSSAPAQAHLRPARVEQVFGKRWTRLVVVTWVLAAAGTLSSFILSDDWSAEGLRLALVVLPAVAWPVRRRLRGGVMQPGPADSGGRSNPAGPAVERTSPYGGADSGLRRALDAACILALLVAAALAGHTRGSSTPIPNLAVALVHVAGIAAWAGGLVALLAVARGTSIAGGPGHPRVRPKPWLLHRLGTTP
jgi:copper transport protein